MIVNNVVALAKAAKGFDVPTILTTVTEERGGYIIKGLQDVYPNQKPINRTTLNAWEDNRVVEAVKRTGRRQLIFAALWTEICLAYPVIHSLADGYDVFFVTDASGGTTREAHDMGVQRMIQAGAIPTTWIGVMSEWQRDWAREATVPAAGLGPGFLAQVGALELVANVYSELAVENRPRGTRANAVVMEVW